MSQDKEAVSYKLEEAAGLIDDAACYAYSEEWDNAFSAISKANGVLDEVSRLVWAQYHISGVGLIKAATA